MEKRCYGCMRHKQQSPICEHCGFNEQIDNLPHQLPLGTVLREQYMVGKVLGQGGFGITYMGWDLNLEIPVAIKEFYPNGVVSRDTLRSTMVTCGSETLGAAFAHNRERFLREARTLARLREIPGIVGIYNFFQENNTAYIIMEYASGIDLRRYTKLRGGRLEAQELLRLLKPVMGALEKVHEAGLVHRDISPDNIMILADGSAKLLDFGAVRDVGQANVDQALSQSTEAILKHGFAPIEQYRRRGSLGPWTDVYALCASIYYCLTGSVPADAPERVMGDDNVKWSGIPGLTAAQINVLERGMAMMPDQRIGSVGELAAALYAGPAKRVEPISAKPEYGTTVPVSAVPEKPDMPVQPVISEPAPVESQPKRSGKTVGILAATVLVVAAAALMFLPGKKEQPAQTMPQTGAVQSASDSWKANLLMEDPNMAEWDQYPTYPALGTQITRNKIETVTFLDSLKEAPSSCWDVSRNKDGTVLAWTKETDSGLYDLYIAGNGGVNGQYACAGLFCGYSNLKQIHFNGCFHTELASDLSSMFDGCSSLAQLDTAQIDTSSARNMGWMFQDCVALTELDVTGFDTAEVTNMKAMFYNCSGLSSLDLSSFDTAKVKDMGFMFAQCQGLTALDLSHFDTAAAVNMYYMFLLCNNLTELDLSSFNTAYVTDMSSMFESCEKLEKLNLSSFQTDRVRDMSRMFAGCKSVASLDLSSFNTARVSNMSDMFLYCGSMTELDVSSFDTSAVVNMHAMFFGCDAITKWDLHHFDTSAVIDWGDFMRSGVQVNGKDWQKLFR